MVATEHVAPARPMRKDALRNRQLLIASAREVFASRGLEASLDDIARHAGVGVGTAYRHFANKKELAAALVSEAVDEIVALAQHALSDNDPWHGLIDFLEGAISRQATNRGLRDALLGLYDPTTREGMHSRLATVTEALLARAQNAGVVRPDVANTDLLIVMAMLTVTVDIGEYRAPDLWRRFLSMCLEGFKTSSETPQVRALTVEEFRQAIEARQHTIIHSQVPVPGRSAAALR